MATDPTLFSDALIFFQKAGRWALLALLGVGACNKHTNSPQQAYLLVAHASPGTAPVNLLLEGQPLSGGSALSFGSWTGTSAQAYDSVPIGVRSFQVTPDGHHYYANGNLFLKTGARYSLFLIDTLSQDSIQMLLLQDYLNPTADTMSQLRFLDLCPDTTTLTVLLTNAQDTIYVPSVNYVGLSNNAAYLNYFSTFRAGSYGISITTWGTPLYSDTVTLGGGHIYTLYTQGFSTPGLNPPLSIRTLQHQ